MQCSSTLRRVSLHAGAALGSFSVCMFKLRVVFVRSGARGGEGDLGSVLLSVRRGSACAPKHRARVLHWALFLFACLNCELCLFIQVQEEAKESSVRCCSP